MKIFFVRTERYFLHLLRVINVLIPMHPHLFPTKSRHELKEAIFDLYHFHVFTCVLEDVPKVLCVIAAILADSKN